MAKILVKKSNPLVGNVKIDGAKNAVLPIIAATLLADGKSVLKGVPNLKDVHVISDLLRHLGAKVEYKDCTLTVDASEIKTCEAPYELVRKMRASFLVMGPLLARFNQTKISMPGGCAIGTRPIDLHLKGFKALGANVIIDHGFVEANTEKLVGSKLYLDFPSVGATENIIMASVLAKGTTIIENAADEPEIWDLINFLNKMGADIYGGGARKIIIKGVQNLHGITHQPIYDRIEAGTFMVAAAITNSMIKINDVNEEHLMPIIEKLKECGVVVTEEENGIIVDGRYDKSTADIKTLPHPGFPTDMQPQFMALMSMAEGTGIINETIFENRFMHISELGLMGANIKIEGSSAIINGVDKITGAKVKATDLRAGAALIIAGLSAEGTSEISDIYHIERGYYKIEEKLKSIGAQIKKIKTT